MKTKMILLDHGSGGLATQELIEQAFLPRFGNPILSEFGDSAVIDLGQGRLAFTTDSYVVDPIFFPGGDIGVLAVNGTINDLSMCGAAPFGLSLGFILEEGLEMAAFERILDSIAAASRSAGVPVVTGDTKVVPRRKADRIFINTSGIGFLRAGLEISAKRARPGDYVILSGTMADHGVAILTQRPGLGFEGGLKSDTSALHGLVMAMLDVLGAKTDALHTLKDPTRGGVATAVNEIAGLAGVGIEIDEAAVNIRPEVVAACDILGIDPFYMANEGKLLAIVDGDVVDSVMGAMRAHPDGRDASVIGRVTDGLAAASRVILKTRIGGSRILGSLAGEPLPRIC